MTIVALFKELLLALGCGLLAIALSARKGRTNHLAGVGLMIVFSVLPDALAGIDLRYSGAMPVEINLPAYFRLSAPMWIVRICVGYIIGALIWRKKRAKPLSRPTE